MKEKKLRKIANYIVELTKQENKKGDYHTNLVSKRYSSRKENSVEYCDLEEKTSEKFIKFINNLVKLKSKINIEFLEKSISIVGDSRKIKSVRHFDDIFEIIVDEFGFRFRKDNGIFYNFADRNMLDKLRPILFEKNKELSNQYLKESIDELILELNLSRENNLDEILS